MGLKKSFQTRESGAKSENTPKFTPKKNPDSQLSDQLSDKIIQDIEKAGTYNDMLCDMVSDPKAAARYLHILFGALIEPKFKNASKDVSNVLIHDAEIYMAEFRRKRSQNK